MKNFCLYSGTKILKLETWNITSIELSSDYTSAIIQGESKFNRSQYTLDITPLVANQYKNGIDPYSATVVNQLTGADDWVLDPANNQIRYKDPLSPPNNQYGWFFGGIYYSIAQQACDAALSANFNSWGKPDYVQAIGDSTSAICYKFGGPNNFAGNSTIGIGYSKNPAYDPTAEEEKKTLPLDVVAQKVISNAAGGDIPAQNYIVSIFNNITDILLSNNHSDLFEQNKKPK